MTRRRWVMASLGVVALLIGGAVAWLAVTGTLAYRQAQDLRASVETARAAATAYDVDQVAATLPELIGGAQRLNALTSGPAWWAATRLPWAGSSIEATRTLAAAVSDIASAGEPLVPIAQAVADGRIRTSEGGVDTAAVSSLAPALDSIASAAIEAQQDLRGLDSVTLPDQLRRELDAVGAELPGLVSATQRASGAAEVLAGFLGIGEPRTWAVLLQNSSEARATGGIVGAYALVTVDDGRPVLTEASDRKAGLDPTPIPYEDVVGRDLISLWGSDLGEWSTYNLVPDFTVTGELTAAGMAKRGTPVTGVVALDSRVVAAILAGTGPVTAAGITIDSTMAADYFTKGIYADVPDVAAKDAATVALLAATLDAALTRDIDISALASALRPLIPQRRLLAWSSVPTEETWLRTSSLGGSLRRGRSTAVVAFNNGSGNKMDAYVETSVRLSAGQCASDAESSSRLEITLRNIAPDGLPDYVTPRADIADPPANSTLMLVDVYSPADASLSIATIDGAAVPIEEYAVAGRPVWRFRVEILQGRSASLELEWTAPAGGRPSRVVTQPMANDVVITTVPRDCASAT